MLGTGKTLEQAVAAFSKRLMVTSSTRDQINQVIASAGAATISDVLHVECKHCGTHTVTASATKNCGKCGTAIASEEWSDITLTAENDGVDDIHVEVEEPMPEEIVDDLEVEESEDSEDSAETDSEETESEETVDSEEDTSEEDTSEEDTSEEDISEDEDSETIEDEIDDLTEESSDEFSEADLEDLSDEELDELDRELEAMDSEAQDTEDEYEDEEILEDESSDDEWIDIEASDELDEDAELEDDLEMVDDEDETSYSDTATDEWVDLEESRCSKTMSNSRRTKKGKAVASDYMEVSEDNEADEMSDQIQDIDLSENTELEASDEITCALVKAGSNVHWQLMCNHLPVAKLTTASIRGSLKALASNGIDTPEFEKALVNTVNAAGKRAIAVAKEIGFIGIKVPAAIPRHLLASVQTDLTKAKSQLLASHLDAETRKLAKQFQRDLRIVAAAINKGFYADVVNPLGSRLTKTLAGLGISNAAQTVKASLAESFEPFFDTLLAKTIEFQQHPTEAKQAIASAIGQMAVMSDDPDSDFEPVGDTNEDYSAFMEVSSTTATDVPTVERIRSLFR